MAMPTSMVNSKVLPVSCASIRDLLTTQADRYAGSGADTPMSAKQAYSGSAMRASSTVGT
jgi:hypothetical protein